MISPTPSFGETAAHREAIRAMSGKGKHPHRTIVIAAFLVGTTNNHLAYTSFGRRSSTAHSLYSAVDAFTRASPGLCDAAMHVVHDIPGLGDRHFHGHNQLQASRSQLINNRSVRDSTTYHGFTPRANYTHACDRRWVLYMHVLKRIEWDCVFAVDLVQRSRPFFSIIAIWKNMSLQSTIPLPPHHYRRMLSYSRCLDVRRGLMSEDNPNHLLARLRNKKVNFFRLISKPTTLATLLGDATTYRVRD